LKYRQIILVSLFSICIFLFANSQSQVRESLELQRLEIIKRIESADKELQKLSNSKVKTRQELRALESKIKSREELIDNIQEDLAITTSQLTENQNKYAVLTSDIEAVKKQYHALLNTVYKQSLGYNKWTFILNTQSINDSFERWVYIKQFQAYCQKAYKKLQTSSKQVALSSQNLEKSIDRKLELLNQQSQQKETLAKDLVIKDDLLKELDLEENKLNAILKEQKLERERLNTSIEKTIIAALTGKTNVTSSTEEIGELSFSERKGLLSWPVDNGVIISKFGRQRHPELDNIYIQNNGIDIQARIGSVAQAVHDGKVVGVQEVPGFGKSIVVKHDGFYTVYAKLDRSYVDNGEEVGVGQRLGSIDVDEMGLSTLHFELWDGKTKLNPLSWITK
jgi:murein DD-endopeptidase MepM/ murein hydrolase activator NlpD